MNRLFFRFFLLVMAAITVATFVIYFAINRLFGDPLDDIARRQSAAQIFLLEQYIDQAAADEWLVRLNKVREVSGVRLELLPLAGALAALPAGQRDALRGGQLVLDVDARSFYRRVDLRGERYVGSADDVIVASGLPIDVGLALKMEALRFFIIALALLIPIAFWSRAHWRGLQTLSRVADRVGAGELGARAALAPRASIYPLAERMNHMAGRIEALLAAQRNLLHSVSHELRTPVARLEFALELLRSAPPGPGLDARIDAMQGDLDELKALVSELLGMNRLDGEAALETAPIALGPMLEGCIAQLPVSALTLEAHVPPDLGEYVGDARLLMRALGNLLRNAQKYAAHTVRLAAWRDGEGRLVVTVEDDGPGIPEAQRARVFEPFYRLDRSRDRETGGFGLGLSIARKAIELHGGSISAEGSPLGGALLRVKL